MLPMMRNQTVKSWRSAEPWLRGSMALALAMETAGSGGTFQFTPPLHQEDRT